MTTAELPEPLFFQHMEFILFKQILQEIVGPAARLFVKNQCNLCNLCFPEKLRFGCDLTAPRILWTKDKYSCQVVSISGS